MDIPIIYRDKSLVVCLKPVGIDSEGSGMTALLSEQLGEESVFCVHRLDKAVGGVMVYALTKHAAAELSRQIGGGSFRKEYLAVIHGSPAELEAELRDLPFVRLSSGALANMAHVRRVRSDEVTLSDGTVLFMSRAKKREAQAAIAAYLGGGAG